MDSSLSGSFPPLPTMDALVQRLQHAAMVEAGSRGKESTAACASTTACTEIKTDEATAADHAMSACVRDESQLNIAALLASLDDIALAGGSPSAMYKTCTFASEIACVHIMYTYA